MTMRMRRLWTISELLVIASLLVSTTLCYTVHDEPREKKHTADQRIAELQALIALANGAAGISSFYGHGIVNPFAAGRRRRRSIEEELGGDDRARRHRRRAAHTLGDMKSASTQDVGGTSGS